ncbi:MAG: Rpn family recombination-promoting nuclease/putative transposase [Acidobacteria bacterium]|nr:Rpn family recombination-promoting nuclease/putative transposase [Acidobacteriota bacterium]
MGQSAERGRSATLWSRRRTAGEGAGIECRISEGVLRERSGLPPVLPVVIYNGRRPWTAPVDVGELIASGRGAALARYQPSLRYFLVDEARVGGGDLPSGNLVSALIALESNRDPARAPGLLGALIDLLRKQDDEELTAAFSEWVAQVLLPRRFSGSVTGPLPRLEEVRAMLAETVQEWTAEWVEQGREQGQRELLRHMAARKFDAAAAARLAAALEGVEDADRLAQVGDWIIECETAADLFARFENRS